MQSITTKYLPATDTKGSRIKATASGGGGSVTVGYRSELSGDENRLEAVRKLCDKLGWKGNLVYDTLESGSVVFVFITATNTTEV